MPRRLPRPHQPKRVRLELSDAELDALEDLANDCRLSVASFVRAMVIHVTETWPELADGVKAAFAKILAEHQSAPPPTQKKRGPKPKGK